MLLTIAIVFSAFYLIRQLLNRFYGKIDPQNEITAKGKIVVITGANAGIGYRTTLEFAKRDAIIILACRDKVRAAQAIENIRKVTSLGQMVVMQLDLSSFESIRNFANEFNKKYERLDILINNGAVMLNPEKYHVTEEGYEIHFGVNHLGHFLLTNLLLDKLKKAAPSRVVTVGAIAYQFATMEDIRRFSKPDGEKYVYKYTFLDKLFFKQIGPGNKPYCSSKLANALFSHQLAKNLEGTGVRTYALCPGVIDTGLTDSLDVPAFAKPLRYLLAKLIFKTPEQGCWTTMYCSLSRDLINKSGEMYQHCAFWDPKGRTPLKDGDARELWDMSERIVGIIPQ